MDEKVVKEKKRCEVSTIFVFIFCACFVISLIVLSLIHIQVQEIGFAIKHGKIESPMKITTKIPLLKHWITLQEKGSYELIIQDMDNYTLKTVKNLGSAEHLIHIKDNTSCISLILTTNLKEQLDSKRIGCEV